MNRTSDSLRLSLERRGFKVKNYSDQVDAVSNFKPGVYDLAILDIRMPRMNGFEVFRQLTRIDSRIKICFLTAFDLYKEEFDRILPDVNAQRFIRKPISTSDFVAKINAVLKSEGSSGASHESV